MTSVNKRLFVVLVALLLMLGMLNTAMPVSAKSRRNVYEGDSIQRAIDLAVDGDTIVINSGVYYQSFCVNKRLAVVSKGAIIDLSGTDFDTAIYVVSSGVTISGFTIRNVPAQVHAGAIHYPVPDGGVSGGLVENNKIDSGFYGIVTNGPSNVEIRNNTVTAVNPIFIINSPHVIISRNTLSAHKLDIDPTWRGQGITLHSGSGGLVAGNEIISEADGINIYGPSNLEVQNNIVHTSVTALNVDSGTNITLKGNVFYASDSGIIMWGTNPNPIVKNNFVSCGNVGIVLAGAINAIVRDNEVRAIGLGIVLFTPSLPMVPNVKVTGNVIESGQIGIYLVKVSSAVVENNEVVASNCGIALSGVGNRIAYNTVTGNFENGISIEGMSEPPTYIDSTDNAVLENTIIGGTRAGDIGIYLSPYTSDNRLVRNIISGVDVTIVDDGTGNTIMP